MNIDELLNAVADGKISVEEAKMQLKVEPFRNLGFAKPDFHRKIRQGAAEVIYGAGKTKEQIFEITKAFIEKGQRNVLITRMSKEAAVYFECRIRKNPFQINEMIKSANIPHSGVDCENNISFSYDELSKVGIVGNLPKPDGNGKIVVATGGTSDIPVALEAVYTAKFFGNEVVELFDVGVAGIHRLFSYADDLMSAQVIIAVAGMEGALASVIGGLVDCPVIAVPTSVGYGASFGGVTALLSMLNSCASGVSVVNIDNGFGAGYLASMINHISANK